MVDDGSHSSFKLLLLAATLAASLSLPLVQPAQAREEADIVTIQAVEPKTPTMGQPLIFAVVVENNSVAQRVGVEDFLPSEVSLISEMRSSTTAPDTTTMIFRPSGRSRAVSSLKNKVNAGRAVRGRSEIRSMVIP